MRPNVATQAMAGRLYVCRTCVRDQPVGPDTSTAGQQLADRVVAASLSEQIDVRVVECLNGCPRPCNVALRGPGKRIYRFSRVTTDDVPALLELARRYVGRADGCLSEGEIPVRLVAKLTVNTPPSAGLAEPTTRNAA